MKLDIQALKGQVVGAPVEKEISWEHEGEAYTATVYVMPNSCAVLDQDVKAVTSGRNAIAQKIAATIVDEAGQPVFNYDEADRLNADLAGALLKAVAEVNTPKKSKPPRKSGTS